MDKGQITIKLTYRQAKVLKWAMDEFLTSRPMRESTWERLDLIRGKLREGISRAKGGKKVTV